MITDSVANLCVNEERSQLREIIWIAGHIDHWYLERFRVTLGSTHVLVSRPISLGFVYVACIYVWLGCEKKGRLLNKSKAFDYSQFKVKQNDLPEVTEPMVEYLT